ncbi:MAG: TIGR01777 family oxidoreductase [bacterium]
MNVLISGASGLIGSALAVVLTNAGHRALRLVRRAPATADERQWDPDGGVLEESALDAVDAVVHLAGENIGGGRWTKRRMARILESRQQGTRLIAEAMARARQPPKVLISASAIGYYGDRPGETLDEGSEPGEGFLADVCKEWEAACAPARERGLRVVNPRFGIVLSPAGGALQRLLAPFKLGLGGRLGSGRQAMSWITLEDAVRVIRLALEDATLAGPVNAVSPHPVTNREFTKALGRVLRRPSSLPAPAFALRLALGKAAAPLLLTDQRVLPRVLQDHGFEFRHPELEPALRVLLKKPSP